MKAAVFVTVRECRACNTPFLIKHQRQVYCSAGCKATIGRTKVQLTCEACHKRFIRRADKTTSTVSGAVWCTGCSRRMRIAPTFPERRNGRMFPCQQCGVEFYRTPSEEALGRTVFCNRVCHATWQRAQPRMWVGQVDNSGRKNGRYRTGARTGEHITKPKVRLAVAERDGDFCLFCGRPPRGLHLHRVRYGSEGGQYQPGNCVQLCGLHHDVVHSDKRLWKPLLLTYLIDATDGAFAARESLYNTSPEHVKAKLGGDVA